MSSLIGQRQWGPVARRCVRVLLDRRRFGLGLAATCLTPATAGTAPPALEPFAIYYGHENNPALDAFRLLVLDPDADPALVRHRTTRATCLGYFSLAEVHTDRAYAMQVAAEGLLHGGNPNWPGARFVDVRDPRWHRRVTDEIVPSILAKGFSGLFLDTLDSAEFLETLQPVRFEGMREGAAALIRAIRRTAPDMLLMVNRGYATLPALAGAFDMLLGESVRTSYDPATGHYRQVSDADYAWQCGRMHEAKARDPRLRLFSLDYWDPADRAGILRIQAEERGRGFIPYVATPDLTTIVPPP